MTTRSPLAAFSSRSRLSASPFRSNPLRAKPGASPLQGEAVSILSSTFKPSFCVPDDDSDNEDGGSEQENEDEQEFGIVRRARAVHGGFRAPGSTSSEGDESDAESTDSSEAGPAGDNSKVIRTAASGERKLARPREWGSTANRVGVVEVAQLEAQARESEERCWRRASLAAETKQVALEVERVVTLQIESEQTCQVESELAREARRLEEADAEEERQAQERARQLSAMLEDGREQAERVASVLASQMHTEQQRQLAELQRLKAEQEARARAEAAARAEAERLRLQREQEAARLAQAAEDARRAREAADKAAQQQAEQQAQVKAASEQRAREAVLAAQSNKPGFVRAGGVEGGSGALEDERKVAAVLQDLRAASQPYIAAGDETKKERNAIARKLATHLLQISATQQQVVKKAADISAELQQLPEPKLSFAIHKLCAKILDQIDQNVTLYTPQNAFPLAEVMITVTVTHPRLLSALIASLQERCLMCVPKHLHYSKKSFASVDEYKEKMKYKKKEKPAEDGGEPTEEWETLQEFEERVAGYVLFLGAMFTVNIPALGPRGFLAYAWRWLVRLLNHHKPCRITGVALHAFLKQAGWCMGQAYGRQFQKLVALVATQIVPALEQDKDVDECIRIRLATCLHELDTPPEGRIMQGSSYSDEAVKIEGRSHDG